MTRPPFGFGPADRPDEPGGEDPFGLGRLLGGGDLFAQLQQLMSWQGGPVNWDLATSAATAAAREHDRPVTAQERRHVLEACRLADLWLDPVTALPASGGDARAWTRLSWVEETLPAWRRLIDPLAGRVVTAMGTALEQGLQGSLGAGLPEQLQGMLAGAGPLQPVMAQIGGFVFGTQVGQALGVLAGEVLSATEVGLPLSDPARPALLPVNIAAFAEGLEVPEDEVRLYLALRETAHARLFAHVPWLGPHLFDAVDAYARGIEVDPSALERMVGSLDPADPASLQHALGEGLFEPTPTPAQEAALARLEAALALVEGWVDAVVDAAARGPLPSAAALRETVRRRRATGGPAEQTFATLVGLQLRPRRLREAAQLWSQMAEAHGTAARDALWAHPDLLPGPADLDDPGGFAARSGRAPAEGTDWDAELRGLDEQ